MDNSKMIFLEHLNQEQMEKLATYKPDVLAAALVFVIIELIALENEDANLPERFEELMTEASKHAIDLADGVHIFIKPTKEVLH